MLGVKTYLLNASLYQAYLVFIIVDDKPAVNAYCPVPGVGPTSPADNDYKPGFAAELMLKDASLAQQAATEVGQATPMGQYAAMLYKHFLANGGEGKDFSGIIEYLKRAERGNV